MRRAWPYLALLTVAALALVGWYASHRWAALTAAGKREAPVRALSSAMGTYYVSFHPLPDPVPLNQPFTLSVAVYDGVDHTKLLPDTTVEVSARMPAHNHGMNLEPQVTSNGDGTAKVDGMLFHMAGHWELYIDVVRDADIERATFDVILE